MSLALDLEGQLELEGQTLEYTHIGPQPCDAPCFVLLHEGLGCVGAWRDFPMRLYEETSWGVFTYSRAGYGASSPCRLPRPLDYMADEAERTLPEVLEQIGFRRGILLGHSDGATIAAIYAGGPGLGEVDGLVLMAPHFFTESVSIEAISNIKREYETGTLRERLERYHGANTERAFRGWNDAWLDPGFAGFDIRYLLPGIDIPVCVIQGEQDTYGTIAQVDVVCARCPGPVMRQVLPECGHAPHQDQTDAVLDAIRAFLSNNGF